MSPRKLTEVDKEELLVAYRETAETTSTLAERYGVSSSTISRFLKSRLSTEDYEDLIQQKRLGRSNSVKKAEKKEPKVAKKKVTTKASKTPKPKLVKEIEEQEPEEAVEAVAAPEEESLPATKVIDVAEPEIEQQSSEKPQRRVRSRRTRPNSSEKKPVLAKAEVEAEKAPVADTPEPVDKRKPKVIKLESMDNQQEDDSEEINPDLLALAQEISLGDRRQALKELLGDDIGDDDEDEDDDYNDDEDDQEEESSSHDQSEQLEEVQILPLASARFPRTCYVVTDKMSELIARPMREFRDLGHIPEEESTKKTLPIFDNHRVAKRFTHGRSQKVIKVPDGSLFAKTSTCLKGRGITYLLLGGQVYRLS
ncbi:MAG: hypothetical protein WBB82_09250 [Limnothrix sp.]